MKGYGKFLIEDLIRFFNENDLQEIVKNVDYGVLKVLEGIWVSYNNSNNDQSKS